MAHLAMDLRTLNLESLNLTEIIRLQNYLSRILTQRFERQAAVAFSDIVGSTMYFSKFGDEAGRRLQQQHVDLLDEALVGTHGQIAHTAGDGILLAFPGVQFAVEAIVKFRRAHWNLASSLSLDQQWVTRTSIHWGPILADGTMMAGDTVNLCSKMATVARPGAILLSKNAFSELPTHLRAICRSIGDVMITGVDGAMELFRLCWHELYKLPVMLRIEETGELIVLPDKPVISIGRLQTAHGPSTNDIILRLHDDSLTNQISRWHLELRRHSDGLLAYCLSDKPTHVDGEILVKGQTCPVSIGTKICLSNVITLRLLSLPTLGVSGATTLTHSRL